VKKILNDKDVRSIDDSISLGVYKQSFDSTNLIKNKVKKISKIVKDLKKIKNG